MFRDEVKVQFKAGRGGNGKVAFAKNRKPNGGIGGNGGDIYLVGDRSIYDLRHIDPLQKFEAESGQPGASQVRKGRDGEDLEVRLPLKTNVYDNNGNLIAEVKQDGERVIIAEGGRGGLGNHYFRGRGVDFLKKFTIGESGDHFKAKLELELQSEVIFIGFPNAGKSSVINEITEAKSKIAPYEFTTLTPKLGVLEGEITLMDLPGLIEETHKGKGLGTSFLKHTRSAEILAHFLSLESKDYDTIIENYERLRTELENISEKLLDKKEFIIFTKTDVMDPGPREELIKKLQKRFPHSMAISIYDLDALNDLKQKFLELVDEQD
jgi:GTP-binding protein